LGIKSFFEKKLPFFHQIVLGFQKKYFLRCCQNFILRVRKKFSTFFSEKKSIPKFFQTLKQKNPAFVGKLQAVLSKLVVAMPEELLEITFLIIKK